MNTSRQWSVREKKHVTGLTRSVVFFQLTFLPFSPILLSLHPHPPPTTLLSAATSICLTWQQVHRRGEGRGDRTRRGGNAGTRGGLGRERAARRSEARRDAVRRGATQ